jgi:hypothetical protein
MPQLRAMAAQHAFAADLSSSTTTAAIPTPMDGIVNSERNR